MDDPKKTPLERYLEKQKGTKETKPPSSIEARRTASAQAAQKKPASPSQAAPPMPPKKSETSSSDMFKWAQPSAPKVPLPPVSEAPPILPLSSDRAATQPPAPTPAPSQRRDATEAGLQAADIGSRAVAYALDLIIIGVMSAIARKIFYGVLSIFVSSFGSDSTLALDLLITYGIMYFYYGTFYSKKGASPGKMLLNLSIIDEERESFLSPGKAFFREAVGKLMSTITLGIGFLAALFRDDRRALHDLLFDTRVVRNIKQSRAENRR